jgi:hypothetical protein
MNASSLPAAAAAAWKRPVYSRGAPDGISRENREDKGTGRMHATCERRENHAEKETNKESQESQVFLWSLEPLLLFVNS